MRLQSPLRSLLMLLLLAGTGALLVWGYLEGRKEFALEQERERPVKPPLRLSVEAGETVVTLEEPARLKGGIAVAAAEPSARRQELRAYGTVLSLQGLIDLYNAHVAAKAQVEKARANLDASRKAYVRLDPLHATTNISDKTLQAAEAAKRTDEAGYRAAQDSLRALQKSIRQQWGAVLVDWLISDGAELDRLLTQQEVLLQITVPAGAPISVPPQTATVQAAAGPPTPTRFLSPSPRTDPRLQGKSWFYLASAETSGLLPGMNVVAYLPVDKSMQGVTVPGSAVVWWQGGAWVYVEKGEGHFLRRAIAADWPVESGWFVTQGLQPGDRIVTTGAQLLLSEELRAQIQVGEEGEKR